MRAQRREARFEHPALERSPAVSARTLDATEALRRIGPTALLDLALATASPVLRDALALRATAGAADWGMLRQRLLNHTAEQLTVRAPELVAVLRVARAHPVDSDDLRAVQRGALVAHERWPAHVLDSPARRSLVELLLDAGERQRAARLLGPRFGRGPGARLALLDIDNPFMGSGGHGERWARGFADVFDAHGLEPVHVEAGSTGHAFDRLRCDAVTGSVLDGPLVSIVLAVRDPGPELMTAVDSIVAQTYSQWQLLLIDDGSGPAADALFETAAARDPRIVLTRYPESVGPYLRRNDALTAARGEIVTFHDGDDWSHPRRLEKQIAPLLGAGPPLATLCASLRVTDRLETVHGRGRALRITESSIMMRRSEAVRLIGFFDGVRRAADSGFRLRLETQGEVRVVEPAAPLSLVRYRASTLSGTDLRDGFTHPARVAYADAHAHWLERELLVGRSPRLEHPQPHRAFSAHPYIVEGVSASLSVGTVLVGDARAHAPTSVRDRLNLAVELAARPGAPVALLHAPEPMPGNATGPFSDAIRSARSQGVLIDAIPGDRVITPRVVVLSTAAALSLAAPLETRDAELVLVVDPDDPLDGLRVGAAEQQLRRAFPLALPTVRRVSPAALAAELAR